MFLNSLLDLQMECALAASTVDEETKESVRRAYEKAKEREAKFHRQQSLRRQQFEMEHGGSDDAA